MKTFTRLLIIVFASISIVFAEPITEDNALRIAHNFFNFPNNSEKSPIKLSYKHIPENNNQTHNIPSNTVYYYVFNNSDNSFVIISGNDVASPVLAYSNESKFDIHNIATATKAWLNQYSEQIEYAIVNNIESTAEIQSEWKKLQNKQIQINKIQNGVSPLVKTKWNQSPFYNDLCPWDEELKARAITGCVATAMAQIMRFWSYPTMGSGSHGYTHPKYGYLFANFGVTYYDWATMPESITEPNLAVATLNYHCGVSVNMGYGVNGSGAAGSVVVAPALINYFKYDKSLKIENRSSYSYNQWITMLKEELLSGRPMYYQGAGNVGGHAFVCDGFNSDNFFHFNWGWGGSSDGYFKMDALNPGSMTFNASQSVVMGIQPPVDQIENSLELASEIKLSSNTIYYGANFDLSLDINNRSIQDFKGDLTAAVLDNNNNLISYIEILKDVKIEWSQTRNFIFSSKGIIGMVPGKYKVYIFQRDVENQWRIVPKSILVKQHFADIEVLDNTEFTLNSTIKTIPSNIIENGDILKINFDVKNQTDKTFKSKIFAGLFNYNRSTFVGSIGEYIESNGLPPKGNYSGGITIESDKLKLPGGSYYLALFYQEEGTENYKLVGSTSNYINPIKIIIKSIPIDPDKYESNNYVSNSTKIEYEFINDVASIDLKQVNIHDTTDIDLYQIILAPNFNYKIDISVLDANSKNPLTNSTVDVVFQYSFDGLTWSEIYDNALPQPARTFGYKSMYVKVKPFFTEQTGIYELYVNIQRNRDSIAILTLQGDLNFGKVELGKSLTRKFVIQNDGSVDLKVNYISKPSECEVDWESGIIPPGEYSEVTVTFTPEDEDEYFGFLVIQSNGVGTKIIEYYGVGWVAENHNAIIQIEGDLNFGEVQKGSIATKLLKVSNKGTSTLKIYSISLPVGFESKWDSGDLAPGETFIIDITFIPTQAKAYTGNIVINCNFNSGVNNIPVYGVGVNPTSVNETNSQSLTIHPNPAYDELNIYMPDNNCPKSVFVIDLTGNSHEIDYICNENKILVDLKKLKSGTYLIKIITLSGMELSQKFIKM